MKKIILVIVFIICSSVTQVSAQFVDFYLDFNIDPPNFTFSPTDWTVNPLSPVPSNTAGDPFLPDSTTVDPITGNTVFMFNSPTPGGWF